MLLAAIMLFVLVGAKVPNCEDEPRYVLFIYISSILSVYSLCLVELMRGKYNIGALASYLVPLEFGNSPDSVTFN